MHPWQWQKTKIGIERPLCLNFSQRGTQQRLCWRLCVHVFTGQVFTGFWRLGSLSGADMLGVKPDIAAYAKLLTGGLLPLAVTLASKDVFKAFDVSFFPPDQNTNSRGVGCRHHVALN